VNPTELEQILILQDIQEADLEQKETVIQSIQMKKILDTDRNLEPETEVILEVDQKLIILIDLQDQDHVQEVPVIHIPTKNQADTIPETKTTETEQNPTKPKETENLHKITMKTTNYLEFAHPYHPIKTQPE
jgi:hypothetical protein